MAVGVGIKESMEVLEAVKVLMKDVKAVLADGKINLSDMPVLFDLLRQLGTLNAGLQNVNLIPSELKDLDSAEADLLIAKVLELAAIFKA